MMYLPVAKGYPRKETGQYALEFAEIFNNAAFLAI
jgi:hypothetical protein